MAGEDLKPSEGEEGKEKKKDAPKKEAETTTTSANTAVVLDAAAEKYMETLPVGFREFFKHAKADKQKALMEKVEVRSDRILFNVTVKGEEKILDVPRLNTQLEEAPQSGKLETHKGMSFSNQETLTELGYKERMITGSMYAAMAQLMPAGDYSLNVVGKAVWELGRLLDLPLVGYAENGILHNGGHSGYLLTSARSKTPAQNENDRPLIVMCNDERESNIGLEMHEYEIGPDYDEKTYPRHPGHKESLYMNTKGAIKPGGDKILYPFRLLNKAA